jgi:GNAT superfamily N-acetyltransferase
MAPSRLRRLEWAILGDRVVGLVAEDPEPGGVIGSVQFVRSRRDPGTWMFGHWRVAPSRRRSGIGRLLLSEGVRLLPAVGRLYSYVDWGNQGSLEAHLRLGFESGPQAVASVPLGALSTIGPPAPAVRLGRLRRRSRAALFDLYRRAMGDLWLRLFPRLGPDGPPPFERAGWRRWAEILARGPARLYGVENEGGPAGFVVWRGASIRLFTDPAACGPALLARVAMQLMDRGASRDWWIDLRGLPREILGRPGPIVAQTLMGLDDARRLSAAPGPPCPPSRPCGRR